MSEKLSVKSERALAISILEEILDTGAYANIALRKALADSELDSRSRAFVTELVNETLRNLLLIDHVLNKFSKSTPVNEMKPFIRGVLRISVCQIRHMGKIPPHAAVNEAVLLTRAFGFENLTGFVNGVLRAIQRDKTPVPSNPQLKYSYPKWLYKHLVKNLGEAGALEFCEKSHQPAPVVVLTNTHKTTVEQLIQSLDMQGVEATPVASTSATSLDASSESPFLKLRHMGDMSKLTAFKEGLFFVMDTGAIHAVNALNVKKAQQSQTIIDVCAAPGGKSFATAINMGNVGKILAYDIYPHRVELIRQTSKRLDLSIITPSVKDALVYDPTLEGIADAVLLDAPCTGFGIIRKHPELKYTRTSKDISILAEKQLKMLEVASRYVKQGGVLVYCTCTIGDEENINNVKTFLSNHQNYTLDYSEQIKPSQTTDGFFVARFKHIL